MAPCPRGPRLHRATRRDVRRRLRCQCCEPSSISTRHTATAPSTGSARGGIASHRAPGHGLATCALPLLLGLVRLVAAHTLYTATPRAGRCRGQGRGGNDACVSFRVAHVTGAQPAPAGGCGQKRRPAPCTHRHATGVKLRMPPKGKCVATVGRRAGLATCIMFASPTRGVLPALRCTAKHAPLVPFSVGVHQRGSGATRGVAPLPSCPCVVRLRARTRARRPATSVPAKPWRQHLAAKVAQWRRAACRRHAYLWHPSVA